MRIMSSRTSVFPIRPTIFFIRPSKLASEKVLSHLAYGNNIAGRHLFSIEVNDEALRSSNSRGDRYFIRRANCLRAGVVATVGARTSRQINAAQRMGNH